MTNQTIKNISRKRFILWSTALIAATGFIKIWNPMKKKKSETAKYLTQDGQLVEVETKHTASRSIKIYTSELKDWIKK